MFLEDLSKAVDSISCMLTKLLLSAKCFFYPTKNFIFLSKLSVKISNVEIHTFWGSGQLIETAIPIGYL